MFLIFYNLTFNYLLLKVHIFVILQHVDSIIITYIIIFVNSILIQILPNKINIVDIRTSNRNIQYYGK